MDPSDPVPPELSSRPPASPPVRLGRVDRLRLATTIIADWVRLRRALKTTPLPDLVRRLEPGRGGGPVLDPQRLGGIVHDVMNVGPFRPRCLMISLVFLRGLYRQGTSADLVLGLPPNATSHIAHCWVEVDGEVVGPPDGRLGHAEVARYGCSNRGG